MQSNWILIGLIAITTYLTRIIGVELMAERKINARFSQYFNYVPVAIITALVVKQIVVTGGEIGGVNNRLSISYPVLIGCLVTAITIKKTESFLPSVALGAIIGLLARFYL